MADNNAQFDWKIDFGGGGIFMIGTDVRFQREIGQKLYVYNDNFHKMLRFLC